MTRAALLALLLATHARAATPDDLLRAYPQQLSRIDGPDLIWRDGTRTPLGTAHPGQAEEDIPDPSLADQLAAHYPAGAPLDPPGGDPGRLRNAAFFDKMYGDCRRGEVAPTLVRVVWLPQSWGHTVTITATNGVDRALDAVSRELDALPDADKPFLVPLGGTYNCRRVAGTTQASMHGWGAAIDLNPALADYWRWRRAGYRNRIPADIVAIFERHGFIWGGRWTHYDTMHFEYRPELLPRAIPP